MMRRWPGGGFWGILAMFLMAGCSGDAKEVKFVEAGGIVTYKGAALADAVVMFIPQNGPLAMARTNLEGKFNLMTGGSQPGVAVGKVKVSVEAGSAKKSSAAEFKQTENPEELKKMQEDVMNKMLTSGKDAPQAESVIPKRYASAETSNLEFTVSEKASENNFKIVLED